MTDLRFTCRSLFKKPGFTAVALLTLALGVGTNLAIFSVVNGILLRPLPYADPDRLVQVWQTNPAWVDSPNAGLRSRWDRSPMSFPAYRDWREESPVFEHFGAFADDSYTWTGGDRAERIHGARMTAEAFAALGVEPLLGRTFSPDEDRVGGPALAVLSHRFWQRLGSEADVLGETLALDGAPYVVVGVMPPDFYFPSGGELWTTFSDMARKAPRDTRFLKGIARLGTGVSLERARRDMEAVAGRTAERHPEHPYGIRLLTRKAEVMGDVGGGLLLLLGTVGLVLLIACANVANLLLVRTTERRREIAVRAALGAGRGRLLRLLIGESLVLSAAGGALGALLALASLENLKRWLPPGLPRVGEIAVDFRVLAVAVALALATGLLVGLLPALGASRANVSEVLAEAGGAAGGRRRHRTLALLVVTEIALAFLLLTGASLLATSLGRLTSVESGFETEQRLTLYVQLPWNGVPQGEILAFYRDVTERLEAVPGVDSVASTDTLPFGGGSSSGTFSVDVGSEVLETDVERSVVTPSYFGVMGIPLLAGRTFTAGDRPGSPGVVVVSQAMARSYWPGESPVGRRLKTGPPDGDFPWLEIVGVAADVRHQGFDTPTRPKLYLPASQHEAAARTLVLKTSVDPSAVAAAAREAVWDVDPDRPVQRLATLESVVAKSVALPRFRAFLITSLAVLAVLLAMVGIYGVMAYAVAQRGQEIGIRMALGARRADVIQAVLARGLRLAAVGLAVGLGLAAMTLRALDSFLFEVSSGDPKLLTATALTLAASAVAACLVPATRAAAVDPAVALRE